MTYKVWRHWCAIRELVAARDDTGSEVVQVALIAAGLVALGLTVLGAINLFVDGQLPVLTDGG